MTMNAADLAESVRLQRVLEFIRACPDGASTREIIEATGTCAVNSVVSEIRRNGYRVDCRYAGKSKDGMRVYKYYLDE